METLLSTVCVNLLYHCHFLANSVTLIHYTRAAHQYSYAEAHPTSHVPTCGALTHPQMYASTPLHFCIQFTRHECVMIFRHGSLCLPAQVYLGCDDGVEEGEVTWKFDFSPCGLILDRIVVKACWTGAGEGGGEEEEGEEERGVRYIVAGDTNAWEVMLGGEYVCVCRHVHTMYMYVHVYMHIHVHVWTVYELLQCNVYTSYVSTVPL